MKRFFRNLKTLAMVAVVGFATLTVSCYDDAELRDSIAKNEQSITDLTARVEALEIKLGNEVTALKALIESEVASLEEAIEAVEDKIVVADCQQGADGTWVLTLTSGEEVTIYPEAKQNGLTVVEENGVYFWAEVVDGVVTKLVDDNGNAYAVHHATVIPEIEIPECHAEPQVRTNADGFTEVSFDGGLTWHQMGGGDTGLFQSVNVTENSLTFVLNGGEEFTVTLPEEFQFDVPGNKVFMSAAETLDVKMKLVSIADVTILTTPAGWEVELNGNVLSVTAPAQDAIDAGNVAKAGTIKMLGVTGENKAVIGKLSVSVDKGIYISLGEAEVMTGWDDDWNPIYEVAPAVIFDNQATYWFENWYGDYVEDVQPFIVGIYPKGEYTPATLAAELAMGYNGNYPYGYDNVYDSGKQAFALEGFFTDSFSGEPIAYEVGGAYTIFAAPFVSSGMSAEINPDDIVLYEYVNSALNVDMVSATPFDVQIKVNIAGYEGYRFYFSESKYSWEDEWDMCAEWGDPFGDAGTLEKFEGSLFDFTFVDNGWSEKTIGLPGTSYTLVIVPIIDGETLKENAKVFVFQTTDVVAGGSVAPVLTEGECDYDRIRVNISAPGAKLTYYSFYNEATFEAFEGDEEVIRESLATNGAIKISEEFEATTSGLSAGQVRYLAAYSVDASGKYGKVTYGKFSSKTFQFSETMTISIDDFKFSTMGDEAWVKVSVTGNTSDIVQYRYGNVNNENTWNMTYGGTVESASVYIATVPSKWYGPVFVDPSELDENGYIHIKNLYPGSEYHFVIIAQDAEGNWTMGAGKDYTPEVNVEFVRAEDEGYETYKPTVTIDSVEADPDFANMYDVNYTITPAEGTTVISFIMDEEYETTYNTAWTLAQYLITNVGTSYYYPRACTEQTTFNFNSYVHPTSWLYVTWSNPAGDTYYETMKLEIPGVTGVEAEGGEGEGEGEGGAIAPML